MGRETDREAASGGESPGRYGASGEWNADPPQGSGTGQQARGFIGWGWPVRPAAAVEKR